MTFRLKKIFENLPNCSVFADVGCDHGYLAKAMIDSGKCDKVIISDISQKCLQKAEDLLSSYIAEGRATSVVSDGFDKVGECDLALIAGMGGEEIVNILKKCKNLPKKLVLQPMKNVDKVRLTAVELGYKILNDFVFRDGRIFYDLIVLEKGEDTLTPEEIEFGRTNLIQGGVDFKSSIQNRIDVLNKCLTGGVSEATAVEMQAQIERLKKYV